MAKTSKSKNRQMAIILACLPPGIFTWLYTYARDKKRFRRNALTIILWSVITILVVIIPEAETVTNWARENNLETDLTETILLICSLAMLFFTVIESWFKAIRRAMRRPQKWYENFTSDR